MNRICYGLIILSELRLLDKAQNVDCSLDHIPILPWVGAVATAWWWVRCQRQMASGELVHPIGFAACPAPELGDLGQAFRRAVGLRIEKEVAKQNALRITEKYKDLMFYVQKYDENPDGFDQTLENELDTLIRSIYASEFRSVVLALSEPAVGKFAYPHYLIGVAMVLFAGKYYSVSEACRVNQNTGAFNGYSKTTLDFYNNQLNDLSAGNTEISQAVRVYIDGEKDQLITRAQLRIESSLVDQLYGGKTQLASEADAVFNSIDTSTWPEPELTD